MIHLKQKRGVLHLNILLKGYTYNMNGQECLDKLREMKKNGLPFNIAWEFIRIELLIEEKFEELKKK